MPSAKNIVFILADQLSASFLKCYGSGIPSTPTLDDLAAEGTRFDRCYASAPTCAPNRATFLTGRSKSIHGILFNNFVLNPDLPTYAHVLGANGYHVGGFGKFHHAPHVAMPPKDYRHLGFHETSIVEDTKWGDWVDWVADTYPEHLDKALCLCPGQRQNAPQRFLALEDHRRAAVEQHLRSAQAKSSWNQYYTSPLPAEAHDTTYIAQRSIDFIERQTQERPGQPFFCFTSFVDPHNPYNPPEPYASLFEPDDMPDPIPAEWIKQGPSCMDQYVDQGGFRQIWQNPQAIREMRALFHGSLRFIDDQIARIVSTLKDNGLWDNTILVFTTDHGEMMGNHGLMTKGQKHYDDDIRCPLIVAGSSIEPSTTDRLTCSLDFYPTFLDWASIPHTERPPLEGKSFAHLASPFSGTRTAVAATQRGADSPDEWTDILISSGSESTVTLVTDDGWRLTRHADHDQGQLFNLNDDPQERQNLYSDPNYAAKRTELLERLVKQAARPGQVPIYRNLPLIDNRRQIPGGTGQAQFVASCPNFHLH